jgi:replicative DNA helicase
MLELHVVDSDVHNLTRVLSETDERLRASSEPARMWPTGFAALDETLSGGLRAGNLILLTGAQGLGKTTFAVQVSRNVVRAGRHVLYFCYEHDPQSILERVLALEIGELNDPKGGDLVRVRQAFEGVDHGVGSLVDRMTDVQGAVPALQKIVDYADRLHVHRSSGNTTSMEVISKAVDEVWASTGEAPMVVVDYLQKVKDESSEIEAERVTVVVEQLKDLSLDAKVPVLSIVAADKDGLETGKRLRARHLRGSTALAYEADVLLVLAHKYDVIARHHLVYDSGQAERHKDWAVLTVEKNRNGRDGVDLEFRKRFDQSRYEDDGHRVAEKLVDERMYVE